MLYPTIESIRKKSLIQGVETICRLMGTSRQAYYQYFKRKIEYEYEEVIIIESVTQIRQRLKIGVRKILPLLRAELTKHEIQIGRDQLFNLLREYGLLIKKKKTRIVTTQSFRWLHSYDNLIIGLELTSSGQVWVCDITYVQVKGCILYLSLITDAYSHKIIGYQIAERLTAEETLKALQMALLQRNTEISTIHHSDHGVQYCSKEYVKLLQQHQISISMAEVGNPYENAIAERVNGIIKNEMIGNYAEMNKPDAIQAIEREIVIYNNERPHLSCDMLTPSEAHTRTGVLKKHWKNYRKLKVEGAEK